MKLIAHRGLINGPNKEIENSIKQIKYALSLGYDVEIDLWMNDNKLYLGHDEPQYHIPWNFIYNRIDKLWIHAKNKEALEFLIVYGYYCKFFYHNTDDYTLTSNGLPWIYPGKPIIKCGIVVLPELHYNMDAISNLDCYAVCSDYVGMINTK